jgi:hypothetical protein
MKKNLLVTAIIIFGLIGYCFCQNTKVEKKDSLKYTGKYYFVQPKSDTVIKYDYITIYEKNNKLYCTRDFLFSSASLPGTSKCSPNHQDYEVISIDTQKGTIVLKFMLSQCEYKFTTDKKTGRINLVIKEGVLVYEKR